MENKKKKTAILQVKSVQSQDIADIYEKKLYFKSFVSKFILRGAHKMCFNAENINM